MKSRFEKYFVIDLQTKFIIELFFRCRIFNKNNVFVVLRKTRNKTNLFLIEPSLTRCLIRSGEQGCQMAYIF
jgi:hypothetical protein